MSTLVHTVKFHVILRLLLARYFDGRDTDHIIFIRKVVHGMLNYRSLTYVMLLVIFGIFGCKRDARPSLSYLKLAGNTMGTTYECTFESSKNAEQVQIGIDSILILINEVASTYIPSSAISQFNTSTDLFCLDKKSPDAFHLEKLMTLSKEVHEMTDGFFNPAIMPLVNYWGFGYKAKKMRSKSSPKTIDSLLNFCDFNSITALNTDQSDQYCLKKPQPETQLDFSAVAKGYAVDLMAQYLATLGSKNYYVNIGGEVVVHGVNQKNLGWTLGVNYPDTSASLTELFAVIQLQQGGMASSGNYRNFYSAGDQLHAHTVNPNTGLAIPSDLLSVTILANNCALADAFATACMAMGYEKGRILIEAHPDLEGFFIYRILDENKLSHYGTANILNKIKIK